MKEPARRNPFAVYQKPEPDWEFDPSNYPKYGFENEYVIHYKDANADGTLIEGHTIPADLPKISAPTPGEAIYNGRHVHVYADQQGHKLRDKHGTFRTITHGNLFPVTEMFTLDIRDYPDHKFHDDGTVTGPDGHTQSYRIRLPGAPHSVTQAAIRQAIRWSKANADEQKRLHYPTYSVGRGELRELDGYLVDPTGAVYSEKRGALLPLRAQRASAAFGGSTYYKLSQKSITKTAARVRAGFTEADMLRFLKSR